MCIVYTYRNKSEEAPDTPDLPDVFPKGGQDVLRPSSLMVPGYEDDYVISSRSPSPIEPDFPLKDKYVFQLPYNML